MGLPCEIVCAEDLGMAPVHVEETGTTLEENARLKACGFFEAARGAGFTDVAVLADDGGIEIDALGGRPGIYANRWAGENATDEQIIAHTLNELRGVPSTQRSARFSVVQVLIFCDAREVVVTGKTEGYITENVHKNLYAGLPYGALLIVSPFGKLYDELNEEEKSHTHRAVALGQIRAIISQE